MTRPGLCRSTVHKMTEGEKLKKFNKFIWMPRFNYLTAALRDSDVGCLLLTGNVAFLNTTKKWKTIQPIEDMKLQWEDQ